MIEYDQEDATNNETPAELVARIKAQRAIPAGTAEAQRKRAANLEGLKPADRLLAAYSDGEDRWSAVSDALASRLGLPTAFAHPAVQAFGLDKLSPQELLATVGAARSGAEIVSKGHIQAIGPGDVPALLEPVFKTRARSVFSRWMQALSWTTAVEMRDLRPGIFPSAAAGNLPRLNESENYTSLPMANTLNGERIQAHLFGAILPIDAEVLLADDSGAIRALVDSQASAAGRMQRQLCFSVLSENAKMADGSAMFGAAHGNDLVGAERLTIDDVSAALSALAALRVNADSAALDLAPRYLIVSSELALAAGVIAASLATSDGAPLVAITSAYLTPGFWYLLPAPEDAPVVARVSLTDGSIDVESRQRPGAPTGSVDWKFSASLGASAVSRLAVRTSYT